MFCQTGDLKGVSSYARLSVSEKMINYGVILLTFSVNLSLHAVFIKHHADVVFIKIDRFNYNKQRSSHQNWYCAKCASDHF